MRLWPREPLIGPLGSWELVRLARRGQGHRTRLLVLYFLFIAFALTVIIWFDGIDPDRLQSLFALGGKQHLFGKNHHAAITSMAAFGNRYALALLEAVLLAVVAITPAYAAASLAEDKERRALDLLLSTPLSDREIVIGKAEGRLGFVLAAAAAALPLLAATTLFGGVSVAFILCGCVIVASTAVLMTAVGVRAAAAAPDLRSALIRAYGLATGMVLLPPPFGILVLMEQAVAYFGSDIALGMITGMVPAFQIAIAVGLLQSAVGRVRHDHSPQLAPAAKVKAVATTGGWGPGWTDVPSTEQLQRFEPATLLFPDLPAVDDDDPVLWKEQHIVGRRARIERALNPIGPRAALYLLGGLAFLLFFIGGCQKVVQLIRESSRDSSPYDPYFREPNMYVSPPQPRPESPRPDDDEVSGILMLDGGALALGLYLLPAALALSAIVARERRQATLDPLLALPLDRRDILWAKVITVMRRGWGWAAFAVVAISLAFGTERGWRHGIAAADAVLGGIALIGGVGTWLSVRCPSEIRSLRLLIPAVVAAFAGPIAVWHWGAAPDPVAPHLPLVGLFFTGAASCALALGTWSMAVREFDQIG